MKDQNNRPVDIVFPQANRVKSIEAKLCIAKPIGCGEPITQFKDELSAREYKITGMCQACQDKFYNEDDSE